MVDPAPPEDTPKPPPVLSARDQVFVQLVRQTSEVQDIAFINPDVFNRAAFDQDGKVDPADIAVMRQMIDAQLPGRSVHFNDEQITSLVRNSLTSGPFARRYEFPEDGAAPNAPVTPFALVNLQGKGLDHRDEYMPTVASRSPDVLAPIPGEDVYWDGFWGIHEGTHPDQPVYTGGGTGDENAADIMNRELEADRAGIAWLRAKGQEDMVQALIDFRALSAANDPTHAALAVLADEPDQMATVEHIGAAAKFTNVMDRVVMTDLGISEQELGDMKKFDEPEYARHVQRLLDAGAYDNADPNPHMREFIAAYAGAVQRRIVEPDPAMTREAGPVSDTPKVDLGAISGGSPVVTLNDGDQATLTIGRVRAPDFFAAIADPVLAEQRIALAQENQTEIGQDFKRTNGAPAPA